MKGKKCPYCGRKISYFTIFHEKKHGIYECARCKKESKIKIDKKLMILFIILLLLIVLYIIYWIGSGNYNNPLGIIPPAILLIIFYFCSPFFIKFVPLKRFLSIDNKKTEVPREPTQINNTTEDYVFDKKVFDEIKNKRRSQSSIEEKIDRVLAEEPNIPIIEDVSEAHTSSQAPLKRVNRTHTPEAPSVYEEDDVREYVPKKEKPDGSRYTANRKL